MAAEAVVTRIAGDSRMAGGGRNSVAEGRLTQGRREVGARHIGLWPDMQQTRCFDVSLCLVAV